MNTRLFLPAEGAQLSRGDVARWYENVQKELDALDLESAELEHFAAYYRKAGLLRPWRRRFFDHHYAGPLQRAISELFLRKEQPTILDLGCGSGTQALLFAMLGAHVIGIDLDKTALEVLSKRKSLYEGLAGRKLDIRIVNGDVFSIDLTRFAQLDGVYSLFAFNMMQPSEKLLGRLSTYLAPAGVLVLQDGNRQHFFNRVFRRRQVLSVSELDAALREIGCKFTQHQGTYAIPPIIWALVPRSVLEPIDRVLAHSSWLAVSYLHVGRRASAP